MSDLWHAPYLFLAVVSDLCIGNRNCTNLLGAMQRLNKSKIYNVSCTLCSTRKTLLAAYLSSYHLKPKRYLWWELIHDISLQKYRYSIDYYFPSVFVCVSVWGVPVWAECTFQSQASDKLAHGSPYKSSLQIMLVSLQICDFNNFSTVVRRCGLQPLAQRAKRTGTFESISFSFYIRKL